MFAGKRLLKIFIVLSACFLLFYGYVNLKKCNIIARVNTEIKMGRYQDALSTINELNKNIILNKLSDRDPLIAYNKGVLYSLLDDKKRAREEYRKVLETKDPILKARALYNNANLFVENMDFSTAAMQYIEVLKLNENDFQAKKNLERMKLAEMQFNTMFTKEREEREDRVEALKLLPWGTKYRHRGEQKIRW